MSALLAMLKLAGNSSEEEICDTLMAKVFAAMDDPNPKPSLQDICNVLKTSDASYLLDPLNMLPRLLLSNDSAVTEILSLMGCHSSSKEVVMAVQEAVERLESDLNLAIGHSGAISPPGRLGWLIRLYSMSIPRLQLRKKTVPEVVHPLISELGITLRGVSFHCSRAQGCNLVTEVCTLVQRLLDWVHELKIKDSEILACKDILRDLLEETVVVFSFCTEARLTHRLLKIHFPRLVVSAESDQQQDAWMDVMSLVVASHRRTGVTSDMILKAPSLASLIILAHSSITAPFPGKAVVSQFLPIILAAVEENTALDECLSFLLATLCHARSHKPSTELSPDVIGPLCTVLPPLAGGHPNPMMRLATFKTLSLLLSMSPQLFRLEILKDLTSEGSIPQIRSAAVGLVKEAVLEGLEKPPNLFASSRLLQTLGATLLRPNLQEFSNPLPSAMYNSHEPSRLVECLGLYYVLLVRDTQNLTGIRETGMMADVEKYFLEPIRKTLVIWSSLDLPNRLPLIALQIALERVDDAVTQLGLRMTRKT